MNYVCTNIFPSNKNMGFSLLIILYSNMRMLTAKFCFHLKQWNQLLIIIISHRMLDNFYFI